jgi:hypothetical protein
MIAISLALILPLLMQAIAMIYAARQGTYVISPLLALTTMIAGYIVLIQNPRMRRWHVLPIYFLLTGLASLQWMYSFLLHVYGIRWSM